MADQGSSPSFAAAGEGALIIVDMINDLCFEGGDLLLRETGPIVEPILRLRETATRLGVPVVYVNDNFGQWHSERSRLIEHCARPEARGRDLVLQMQPRKDDFFVIKPQFSGFYSTNLPVLLPKLGVRRLILTGAATDICVLFTAGDAHMRDYELWVPEDCVAANDRERGAWALAIMEHSMGAETRATTQLPLDVWLNDSK